MGVFEGQSDLAGDLGGTGLSHRDGATDLLLKRCPRKVGHRDERPAVDLARIEDCANIRVMKDCGGAGFAGESLDPRGRLFRVKKGQFEGDLSAELGILGEVDRPHSAFPQHPQNTIATEFGRQLWKGVLDDRRPTLLGIMLLPIEGRLRHEGLPALLALHAASADGIPDDGTRVARRIRAADGDRHRSSREAVAARLFLKLLGFQKAKLPVGK